MDSPVTTANTSIPISKMVNDLFLQWLSLPDTRTTLTSALHSVRTNSKMPDPIPYSKVEFSLKCVYHGSIDSRRSTQHVVVAFRSLNISIHHLFPLYLDCLQVHVLVHRIINQSVKIFLISSKKRNHVHRRKHLRN